MHFGFSSLDGSSPSAAIKSSTHGSFVAPPSSSAFNTVPPPVKR